MTYAFHRVSRRSRRPGWGPAVAVVIVVAVSVVIAASRASENVRSADSASSADGVAAKTSPGRAPPEPTDPVGGAEGIVRHDELARRTERNAAGLVLLERMHRRASDLMAEIERQLAAADGLDADGRADLQDEFENRRAEVDRLAEDLHDATRALDGNRGAEVTATTDPAGDSETSTPGSPQPTASDPSVPRLPGSGPIVMVPGWPARPVPGPVVSIPGAARPVPGPAAVS